MNIDGSDIERWVRELERLDKKLGYLFSLPALQRSPTYVRAELTETRDQMMMLRKVILEICQMKPIIPSRNPKYNPLSSDQFDGFTIVGKGSSIHINRKICEQIGNIKEVQEWRARPRDSELSTVIVDIIKQTMKVDVLTQAVVDEYEKR